MRKNVISKEKIFYLVSIMAAVSFVIGSLAIGISYYASFEQKRQGLIETAKSQARLIEAVAKFDDQLSTLDHPEGSFGATLSQVIEAHENNKGFGETGEFVLAKLEGDQIVFLFSHRFLDMDTPKPVPFDSHLAEPMRRALEGESGSIEGLDYRGEPVLAAYEPVSWSDYKIGIVAKIDISEIQRPFAIAGMMTGLLAIIILGFGLFVFKRITRPFATSDSEVSLKRETGIYWFLAAPVFLAAVIFYIDISIPLGVAGGVPYVALFLFSVLSPTRFFIISIGILGTIMTVVGFFLSPESGLLWMVLVNRFLAIFAIWITAILTLYHKETEIKAVDSAKSLEKSQEIAHIGSFDWNIKTNELSWTEELYKIFGLKPQEFNPTLEAFFDTIHPHDREIVKQAVDDSIKNDVAIDIEYTIVRPDNQERVVHAHGLVYRDKSGKPLHLIGTAHDITERKKAGKALLESELWMRSIYSSLDEAVLVASPDRKFINFNEAARKIFGYSFDELKNMSTETLHVDHQHYVEFGERIRQALDKDQTANFEFVAKKKNGDIFPSEHTVSLLKNPDGEQIGIVSVVRDITERKKAGEELRESEQRLRKLSETAFEGMVVAEKGNILECNAAFTAMFGYAHGELIGMSVVDLTAPEDIETVSRNIAKGYEGIYEMNGMRKDGSTFPIEVHGIAATYQGRAARITAIRDITERKRAEEALFESEERYRLIVEGAKIIAWEYDPDKALFTFVSSQAGEILGYQVERWYEKGFWESHIYTEDRESAVNSCISSFRKGEDHDFEYRMVSADGQIVWFRDIVQVVGKDGKPISTRGIMIDITERKKAEESLSSSEQKFRALTQSASDAIITADSEGKIVTWNRAAETIFGYSKDEALSQNITILVHERYQERHRRAFELAGLTGDLKNAGRTIEVEGVKKDGSEFPIELSLSSWRMDGILFFTSIIRDITERKRTEEELLKHRDHLEELVNSRTEEIKLIQKIAIAANEASTVDEAALTCISKVCGYTGWEIGHVCSPDDDGVCIPTDLWHVKNPERFDAFLKVTMNTVFAPGVGLPGRVYESGESVWVKDVTRDTNFPRAKIAEEIGMKAGFAFPVMDGENVSSILEFFTTIAVEPDQLLLDTVKHLASQLGRLAERKRTERELSLKNHAIDSSMDAMMMTNLDFEITYVNQKMCELWGYAEKELLGRDTSILRAEEHLKGAIQKVLSEKGEYEGEFLTRRKDGSTFIAYFSSSMVEDENGKMVSNITSFVDLTERIRNEEALRESSRQLEESQRVANLGTYTLDISSGVRSTSMIHDRIYGINNPEYIVNIERWLKIIHPDQREEIKSYFTNHVLVKGARFDKEYRIIRLNDRQERWVHDLGELILDQAGRPVKMIGTVQDITERKRAERALIAAKEAAEAATRLKDKFVSLASHDLRSPLSSIIGFLNFLKSDTKNPLCQEHNDIVNRMILTTDHQLNMIDGLLDLTRMQTGNILLEPRFANANLIGEDIVQNMLFMAQAKEITLVNDIPANARLYADITYFSEVIGNLVSNAVKFCNKGDMVRLFTPDNKKSIIAVSDTGVGIDSKTLCRLFAQEDKTSTIGTAGEKGAGLGLPYSYEIMQAHGGNLYAESTIGEGTVFFAKLPYVKPQLLVVDDDEKVRGLIKAYLDPLDVYIKQAVDGSEAIEILKLFVPHLIITDISMPVVDGLQLLEHVRGNPAIKSVPVIIMTGTDMHLREKAFQMQASDFITKPLMEDEFLPRIRRFIG